MNYSRANTGNEKVESENFCENSLTSNNNWSQWTPNQIRQPKSIELDISETQLHEKESASKSIKLTKRKRLTNKEKEQNIYENLAKSKMELVELQKQLLKKEHEEMSPLRKEKHKLEIELLKIKIENEKESLNYTCTK